MKCMSENQFYCSHFEFYYIHFVLRCKGKLGFISSLTRKSGPVHDRGLPRMLETEDQLKEYNFSVSQNPLWHLAPIWDSSTYVCLFGQKYEDTPSLKGIICHINSCLDGLLVLMLGQNVREWTSIPIKA